jgi:hypothetical protein
MAVLEVGNSPEAHARRLAREIEKLGFDVTLQPHAAA